MLAGAGGAFVIFPGVDEALYLADATTGEVHDRLSFAWPLEVALHGRPGEVVVPHPLGVTAFGLRE